MGQAQLLADEVVEPRRQLIAEMLEAIDRIRAIVSRMRRLTRVELMDGCPGLPMLDLRRSSEPDPAERSAASVGERLGERRRSDPTEGGRRRGPRRQQDISADLQTRGWALVRR